jgi:hypothetical protein
MSPPAKPLDINTLLARNHAEHVKCKSLAKEEEHADDLADLLQQVSQPPPQTKIGPHKSRLSGPKPSNHSKKHHKEKSLSLATSSSSF